MRILSPAVVAIGALFVIGVAIIWHHWGPEFDNFAPSNAASSTPSSVATLLGKNAHAAVGDMVYLNEVVLRPGPKPNLFLVSGAKNERMLVFSDLPNSFVDRTALKVDIKIVGNSVLSLALAVAFFQLWKVAPKSKDPATLDQQMAAFAQRFPWLSSPPSKPQVIVPKSDHTHVSFVPAAGNSNPSLKGGEEPSIPCFLETSGILQSENPNWRGR